MRTVRGCLLILGAAGGPALAQATFTGLGHLPGHVISTALNVSADGLVVVGESKAGSHTRAFRWTSVGGMTDLGPAPGAESSYGRGINSDGSVVVGSSLSSPYRAFRWTPAGGTEGFLSELLSVGASAVSGDGSVIVGTANSRGYRWTEAAGAQFLGALAPGHATAPQDISADGQVVVGYGHMGGGHIHAFRWTAAGGAEDLGTFPGGRYSFATGVSSDGAALAGFGDSGTDPRFRAWRWTAAQGLTSLGPLPGETSSRAWAVSDDGSVIVGDMTAPSDRAFLWNAHLGMVDLNAYLPALGVDLTGWVLKSASAVSADGRVIVGAAEHNGSPEAWIATIPAPRPCYANCDGSAAGPILNIADFGCFLGSFAAGESYANCDGSAAPPTLSVADFVCFLNKFAAGCW